MILLDDRRKSVTHEELELSIEDVRKVIDGYLIGDFESALGKLQGDARVQGEAQYLVLTVKP